MKKHTDFNTARTSRLSFAVIHGSRPMTIFLASLIRRTLLSVGMLMTFCFQVDGAVSSDNSTGVAPMVSPGNPSNTTSLTIPVSSSAFVFSPGNWSGDAGRDGNLYRQTWNPGAYFRVSWTTSVGDSTKATLLLDTSTFGSGMKNMPMLTYNIDGFWKSDIPCGNEINIEGLSRYGTHTLTVYLQSSSQINRWTAQDANGLNVVRVTGLRVDPESIPVKSSPNPKWLLEVGDSITEGIGPDDNLSDYSFFVGKAFQSQGYEYCVSACGYSGWICKGDASRDVPAYYFVSGSVNGEGGKYEDAASRWNKIDSDHSLLDANGHLSAYGQVGQEPSIITINYGTNEAFTGANKSDTRASITQCLAALRKAAPDARIFVIIPFGQFYAKEVQSGVDAYRSSHPEDRKVSIIDLGQSSVSNCSYISFGVHPNIRAHAAFAPQIVAAIYQQILSTQ